MKNKEMFDEKLMDEFRNVEEPSENTKQAWYIFCYKLLPIVNEFWGRLIKDNNVIQKPDVYEHTTVSDEALIRWVILCRVDKFKDQESQNWIAIEKEKKGKKFGPHDSLQKRNVYVEEYHKTISSFQPDATEKKRKWNNIFWEMMQIHHESKFSSSGSNKKAKIDRDVLKMPDEDPEI
jgi:hypothetical protein